MGRYRRLWRLSVGRATDVNRDVDDEIQAHIDMRIAEYVAAGMGGELVVEPALYLSAPETLLDVLRRTPDTAGERAIDTVALVAHNPGMTQFVNLLAGEYAVDNMVTFASAQLDVDAPWHEVTFGSGTVVDITVPRSLPTP